MLGSAAAELADTDKMIDAGQRLFGSYLWQRYDIWSCRLRSVRGNGESDPDLPHPDLHRRDKPLSA